jgi:hypothetical protein
LVAVAAVFEVAVSAAEVLVAVVDIDSLELQRLRRNGLRLRSQNGLRPRSQNG